MISCEASQRGIADYHSTGSAFSYKAADTYRHFEKNSNALSAALDSALHYHKKSSAVDPTMNSMGMGPGGYANYVPQIGHASSGFGTQYGSELSHAYDTRHTANSWYSPSAAADPTSRFNEYACK